MHTVFYDFLIYIRIYTYTVLTDTVRTVSRSPWSMRPRIQYDVVRSLLCLLLVECHVRKQLVNRCRTTATSIKTDQQTNRKASRGLFRIIECLILYNLLSRESIHRTSRSTASFLVAEITAKRIYLLSFARSAAYVLRRTALMRMKPFASAGL